MGSSRVAIQYWTGETMDDKTAEIGRFRFFIFNNTVYFLFCWLTYVGGGWGIKIIKSRINLLIFIVDFLYFKSIIKFFFEDKKKIGFCKRHICDDEEVLLIRN